LFRAPLEPFAALWRHFVPLNGDSTFQCHRRRRPPKNGLTKRHKAERKGWITGVSVSSATRIFGIYNLYANSARISAKPPPIHFHSRDKRIANRLARIHLRASRWTRFRMTQSRCTLTEISLATSRRAGASLESERNASLSHGRSSAGDSQPQMRARVSRTMSSARQRGPQRSRTSAVERCSVIGVPEVSR